MGRRLSLLFFCLTFVRLIYAQGINSIFPKNDQFIENDIQFQWNEKVGLDIKYLIQITNSTNLVADSTLKETSILISLPIGEYSWVVYAIENSVKVDSTVFNQFSIFTPKGIDSLQLWLNGDSIEKIANNKVQRWYDQSDSAFILSQNSTVNQPTIVENVLNGFDGISFTTAQFIRSNNAYIDNSNYYIVAMYSHNGAMSKKSRLIYGSANWFLGSFVGDYLMFDGINILNAGSTIQNKFVVHSIHSTSNTVSAYLNGQLKESKSAGPSPGLISISRNSGDYFDGVAAEIIMYNGTISNSERESIDNYLMDKYAPPVNLGVDRMVCSFPDSIALDIDYALDYQWSTADTNSAIQIDSAGKYYVTITDIFGRSSTDSIYVSKDTTDYKVDFGYSDTSICVGDTISLQAASFDRFSYSWNTTATTPSVEVTTAGQYILSVQNCLNNAYSDTIKCSCKSTKI